jgi:hypothetical protein
VPTDLVANLVSDEVNSRPGSVVVRNCVAQDLFALLWVERAVTCRHDLGRRRWLGFVSAQHLERNDAPDGDPQDGHGGENLGSSVHNWLNISHSRRPISERHARSATSALMDGCRVVVVVSWWSWCVASSLWMK